MSKYFLVLVFLFCVSLAVAAESCAPNVTLINQDPYPAVPGNYVKLVFQISSISSSDCGDINFVLLPKYPLILDPRETGIRTFSKVDYLKDYNTNILVPYKVRVDENAVDGSSPIEINLQNKGTSPLAISKTFNLEIKNTKTTFDVFVKDFDYGTNTITLQILNTGDSDIQALTVEIPKQESIIIKGANKVIVGDLDSNEYTTADFESIPSDGKFNVNLIYSDENNIRRITTEEVTFDSSYFKDRPSSQKKAGIGTYIFYLIIIVLIIYLVYRFAWKRKKK